MAYLDKNGLNRLVAKLKDYINTRISESSSMDSYSTEEHIVGTWIDGRPVYEKTVSGTYSSNGSYSASPEIAAGIDIPISIFGILGAYYDYEINESGAYLQIPSKDIDLSYNTRKNRIFLYGQQTAYNNAPYKITIRYVKS